MFACAAIWPRSTSCISTDISTLTHFIAATFTKILSNDVVDECQLPGFHSTRAYIVKRVILVNFLVENKKKH